MRKIFTIPHMTKSGVVRVPFFSTEISCVNQQVGKQQKTTRREVLIKNY
jgi:hypothetical protein